MDKLNKIIEGYPVELKMLLVCCGSERWVAGELLPAHETGLKGACRPAHAPAPKGSYAHETIDWEKFYQWMRRHRVAPAVYRYIKKNPAVLPEEVVKKVEQRFAQVTKRNLLLAGETIQICKTLESHGIKAIPLKGVFLAKQLYNDYNYRETRDIDVLVEFNDLQKSLDALKKIGYTLSNPKVDINKKSFQFINHHVVFSNTKKRTSLELHWRLFVFEGMGDHVYKEIRKKASVEIETGVWLSPVEDHMHFVIMHGHHHWWHAMQWLVDVKDYVKTKNPVFAPEIMNEVEDIYQQTLAYVCLLFDRPESKPVFFRKGQVQNIANSMKVLSEIEGKELINPLTRIRRIGLFFDMNRSKKGFWREY
jgi:hypothetical protein